MATLLEHEAVPSSGETSRLVLKGAVGLSAGRGLASLISAAWLIIVARHLSLAHFGDLAVLLALGTVFTTVSDPGLQMVLAQHVAKARRVHAEVLHSVLLRRQAAGVACAVLTAALYLAVADRPDPVVPALFTCSILCSTVYGSVLTAYRALGSVAVDGANEVLSRLFVIGVGTWWLLHGGGLRAVVATYALADAASAVVVYTLVRKRFVEQGVDAPPADLSLRATAPLAFVMVTQVVYYKLDTYLVGMLKGSASAGLYGAAYRLVDGALIPAAAVASVILAHTASLTRERIRHDTRRHAALALALTLPLALIGSLLARPILRDLFGASFARASATAVILLVSAVPGAVVAAYAPVAGLLDRRAFAVGAGLALVLNAVANLLLIPEYGLPAAAWVNVGSQVFLGIWLVHIISPRGRLKRVLGHHQGDHR